MPSSDNRPIKRHASAGNNRAKKTQRCSFRQDPRLRKEEGLSMMKRTDLTLDDVYHAGRADRISRD